MTALYRHVTSCYIHVTYCKEKIVSPWDSCLIVLPMDQLLNGQSGFFLIIFKFGEILYSIFCFVFCFLFEIVIHIGRCVLSIVWKGTTIKYVCGPYIQHVMLFTEWMFLPLRRTYILYIITVFFIVCFLLLWIRMVMCTTSENFFCKYKCICIVRN